MISYCSRDCQKKDWKSHKTLCKLLGKLRGGNGGQHLFHKDPEAHVKVAHSVKAFHIQTNLYRLAWQLRR